MEDITDGELQALRNLAEKQSGRATAFVNIADARQLTNLGLAVRSQQGWEITPAGAAYLKRAGLDDDDDGSVQSLRPPPV